MSLIARLSEKSWETPGFTGLIEPTSHRPPAARLGLYVFLCVATVIFVLFSGAYLMRMGMHGDMGHGDMHDWHPMPKPLLLWINTCVLASSSLAWEAARRLTRRDEWAPLRVAAVLGTALAVLFLLGQLQLWKQYQAAGYFLATNPANAFFYLLTAVHGLHLSGGLFAAFRTFYHMADAQDGPRIRLNIQLCAIYWHFLLAVWIVLFALLLST